MSEIPQYLEGIVHEETQAHDGVFDLTVDEIYDIETPGRVDFGGGELEGAGLTPHEKKKRNPEDDYSWWNLDSGSYLIEYNESLDSDERILLQPRDEILERGAFHPTVRVNELSRMPLTVSKGGIKIKENARISTLITR